MRIVQTLWTKPVFDDDRSGIRHRFNGGWLSRKYYYIAWALSCLQFRKYYKNVELVTDTRGEQIMIEKLKLPFTRVTVELDCLNHYPDILWTLPKIYTYKIQKEPFIHADGDVFIWQELGIDFENSPLCSQQLVIDHKPQYITMNEIMAYLDFIPDCIRKDYNENKILKICNAGILGGTNLSFFEEYVEISFEFVNRNINNLGKIKSGNFGMIFEEYLFYCLAKERGLEIKYFLNPLDDDFKGIKLVDFETVPSKTKFIHPLGAYKKYQQIADLLASTLLTHYPDYYFRILELLRDFEI